MRAQQMDLFMEITAGDERAALIRRNRLYDTHRQVTAGDLRWLKVPLGTEVIVERVRTDPETWKERPEKSSYYRTILGQHNTVSGPTAHLTWEESDEWPEEPPWQPINGTKWIYPDSGTMFRYWVSADENGL